VKRLSPWRWLKRTFLTGLFIVAPISLTILLVAWFISLVDGLLSPVTGRMPIPGLGVIVATALVLLAGALGSNIIGQQLLELTEELLLRIPVLNWVYRTMKQLSEVFSPAARAGFRTVVLVEYPRPSVFSLGFVTNDLEIDGKKLLSVYVPTNHLYIGDVILVPAEAVKHLALSQQESVQAFISAGASLPKSLKTK